MTIPQDIVAKIELLTSLYQTSLSDALIVAKTIADRISDYEELQKIIHTIKWRVKAPDSFKHKLERKYEESLKEGGEPFDFNEENLFDKITDLAGVRILHIHTTQIEKIKPLLEDFLLNKLNMTLFEPPKANVWDIEYEKYYRENVGIETKDKHSMYTSVHYVYKFNDKIKVKCEIQIRTLIEETWGEVSHTINYPDETKSIACQEQIRALARVTSSGTRLIDSIFKSKKEFDDLSTRT